MVSLNICILPCVLSNGPRRPRAYPQRRHGLVPIAYTSRIRPSPSSLLRSRWNQVQRISALRYRTLRERKLSQRTPAWWAPPVSLSAGIAPLSRPFVCQPSDHCYCRGCSLTRQKIPIHVLFGCIERNYSRRSNRPESACRILRAH